MSSYINNSALEELFATVELRHDPEARMASIKALRAEFVALTVTSLERVCYDLAERGWTAPQIADEIGVSRDIVARLAGAYAQRAGLLSPFPSTRRYDNALDISKMVRVEAARRVEQP